MGSGGITSASPPAETQQEETDKPLCDWDEWAAWYIAIGVPAETYWDGYTEDLPIYARAHELKIEQRNQELWLQGLYVYEAFGAVLANAFGKKGSKKETYPEEPHRITPMTEAEKKAQAEKDRQKAISAFSHMMDAQKRKNKANGVS